MVTHDARQACLEGTLHAWQRRLLKRRTKPVHRLGRPLARMPSAIFSHGTVAINCLVEPPANTIQVGFKAMEETSTIIHQSQPPAEGDATTMTGCSFSIGHCIHRTRGVKPNEISALWVSRQGETSSTQKAVSISGAVGCVRLSSGSGNILAPRETSRHGPVFSSGPHVPDQPALIPGQKVRQNPSKGPT